MAYTAHLNTQVNKDGAYRPGLSAFPTCRETEPGKAMQSEVLPREMLKDLQAQFTLLYQDSRFRWQGAHTPINRVVDEFAEYLLT